MVSKICILTSSGDVHADKVEKTLHEKGVSVIRVNSDEISDRNYLKFVCEREPDFIFRSGNKDASFAEIKSIWFRKPDLWNINYNKVTKSEGLFLDFKSKEINHFFRSVMYEAERRGIFLVSKLTSIVRARNKPMQLVIAKKIGLQIPHTLITSSPNEIEDFLREHDNQAIVKAIDAGYIRYGNKINLYFTSLLTLKEFKKIKKEVLFDHPILLQEKVDKEFELRITIIGKRVCAASIDSQASEDAKLDWRRADVYSLPHNTFKLHKELERACIDLCSYYGLQFGAIDMAVTPEKKYVFFEINPNGQYLWIENQTGLQLSKAMAELLNEPRTFAL